MKKVTIEYPLPFYVPIQEGIKIISGYPNFADFRFECKKYKNESFKSKPEPDEFCTTITIDFMLNTEVEISDHDLITLAIRNSITYLNNLLDSLRLVNDKNYIKNFSITDLPPMIKVQIGDTPISYVTIPTTILQDTSNHISRDNLEKVFNRLDTWDKSQYFEVIDKFLSRALHHLYTEEFMFAVIELQTSFEAFIRLCHNVILIEKGATEKQIKVAANYHLKNTIVDHLGKALNENLNFKTNPIIIEWHEKLYSLRNTIVHSGFSYVSGEDAYEAFDAFEKIINYFNSLMTRNGYFDENGEVGVNKLCKNTPDAVDFDEITESLIKRGLIDEKLNDFKEKN